MDIYHLKPKLPVAAQYLAEEIINEAQPFSKENLSALITETENGVSITFTGGEYALEQGLNNCAPLVYKTLAGLFR